MQTEVAHHGGDERVLEQLTRVAHGEREDREDLVAVDRLTLGVHGEAAVGVTVVRDAEVGTVLADRGGHDVDVGGTTK